MNIINNTRTMNIHKIAEYLNLNGKLMLSSTCQAIQRYMHTVGGFEAPITDYYASSILSKRFNKVRLRIDDFDKFSAHVASEEIEWYYRDVEYIKEILERCFPEANNINKIISEYKATLLTPQYRRQVRDTVKQMVTGVLSLEYIKNVI